jgi:hypothetical protein
MLTEKRLKWLGNADKLSKKVKGNSNPKTCFLEVVMDNLEVQNSTNETSFGGAVKHLFVHPLDAVVLRWNWKAAVLSALLRSPIFLFAYRREGLSLAIGAALAQFLFRTIFGGVNGAIIQAFSKVEPPWHALLTVPLVLTVFSHVVEFIVQTLYDNYNGTTSGNKAILTSIIISVISAVFNLFAMRRGALLVKDEHQQSLWKDFKSFPRITFEFIVFAPRKIYEMIQRGQYFQSIFTTLATCAGTGLIVGSLLGKLFWGLVTGGIVLALIIIALVIIANLPTRKFPHIEVASEP